VVGVGFLEDRNDRVDVKAGEGTGGSKGGGVVTDIQGVAVEPDVGFYGDGTDGEGGVEGDVAPVVVVGVELLLLLSSIIHSVWKRVKKLDGDQQRHLELDIQE
jgi:hypothetical protein